MEKGEFMRIFKLEFQKIMKNPMLWLLAVIFCLVNCLVIYNEAGNKDTSKELVIMHDIIKKTDDINHSRQAKNRNERKQLSKAYQEYYKENIDLYDKLDMTKILKQKEEMLQYHPKGFMKKFVKDNYEHLQKRVEEIKSDKEYNDAFYPGQYYEIHSLLYSKLGKKLIVEMSLLMALSILFIMDYERLQKTNDLVDATRTGKRIMDYKAFTGTLSGILFSAILCSVTWIYFFYCVSFKGLWNVSVASTLVAEKRYSGWFYPFVTFFKMTQIQYLILTLTVISWNHPVDCTGSDRNPIFAEEQLFFICYINSLKHGIVPRCLLFECNIYECYITPAKPNKSLYYKRSLVYGK